jgi:hypothetical protein
MVGCDLDFLVAAVSPSAADVWWTMLPLLERCEHLRYADETGDRVAETAPYERHYFVMRIDGWKVDVSVWTADVPESVETFTRSLPARLDPTTRLAILRLKDAWFEHPAYPDVVGGWEIYHAVLEHGVRTLDELDEHLAERGLPTRVR